MKRQYITKFLILALLVAAVIYTYVIEQRFLQPVSISSIFVLIYFGIKIYDEVKLYKVINDERTKIQKVMDWTWIVLLFFVSIDIITAFFIVGL